MAECVVVGGDGFCAERSFGESAAVDGGADYGGEVHGLFVFAERVASLVTTFKRVANIVRQANANTGDVNPALFEDNAENALHSAILDAKNAYQSAFDAKDYESALTCLEALRAPADAFFEAVLVNCDDPNVRQNRLNLLATAEDLFANYCDVRKL
mgnify:CR=1 FL=1